MALTRTDIAALRKAQSLIFSHDSEGSKITAFKKGTDKDPFEGTAKIACQSAFPKSDPTGRKPHKACYHSCSYTDQNPVWQTIASLLREGDELVVVWYEDAHTTIASEQANLHGDTMYLRVIRDGKRKYEFLIAVAVTRSDSSVRMIRDAQA